MSGLDSFQTPGAIDVAKLLALVKPDVMGWVNQIVANAALNGIDIQASVDGQDIQPHTVVADTGTDSSTRALVGAGTVDGTTLNTWAALNRGPSVGTGAGYLMGVGNPAVYVGGMRANITDTTAGAQDATAHVRVMRGGVLAEPIRMGVQDALVELGYTLNAQEALYVNGTTFGVGIGDASPDSALEIAALSNRGYITLNEVSAPVSPGSNKLAIYAKDNGSGYTKLYTKDNAGIETELGAGSGVSLPSLSSSRSHLLIPWGYGFANSGADSGGVNTVRCLRFFLPIEITVASLHFEIITAETGKNCSLGVYSSDGSMRLTHTGAISASSTGGKSVILGSSITLPTGMYWLAWTANGTSVRLAGQALVESNLINLGSSQAGTASNLSSAGALPSSLGTISAGIFNVAKLKLQG